MKSICLMFLFTLVATLVFISGLSCDDEDDNSSRNKDDQSNDDDNDTEDDDTIDDDDNLDDDDDNYCPEDYVCEDYNGEGYMGCLDEGEIPDEADVGCHQWEMFCFGNATCHYTDKEQTQSACVENCGRCQDGQACFDVSDLGFLGCFKNKQPPDDAETQCHEKGGCQGNYTCFYTNSSQSKSACIRNCSVCSSDSCGVGQVCNGRICVPEPCTKDSCDNGNVCWDGRCVPDTGNGPGVGPGPECPSLPELICDGDETYCGELIQFDPTEGDGYIDYPENFETWSYQWRSWLRRDMVMLVQYAAAYVACKAEDWEFGNGGPVGLIDMSEEDGAIPGTSLGMPGHPPGTHENGFDIDIAYYQVGTANNRTRIICDDKGWWGGSANHCTTYPDKLDPWRQALFIGALFEHPELRLIGCDGKAGPMIEHALEVLCDNEWLSEQACSTSKLVYEEYYGPLGWYHWHHHHIHVSRNQVDDKSDGNRRCHIPGCEE